ncbi:MAG: hypothetical protein ABIQ02_03300 [Saprospiraceae bacterium]
MTDFQKISHLIRFGLSFHKMTVENIIDWSDSKINEQTDNDLFFDLSTAGTTSKIVDLLSVQVTWEYNNKEIRRLLLSYYNEYLKDNSDKWIDIEKELLEYFHLLDYNNSNERVKDFLYFLEDDWHLRKDGYGGLLQMPKYLRDNLAKFQDYDKLKEFLKGQGLIGYEI